MKRRLKKGPIIFIIVILLLIFSFFFIRNINSDNNVKEFKEKSTEIKKEEKEDVYKLRDGEEFIKKTTKGFSITKYNGAYYVNGTMIVNKTYNLDSTYKPVSPINPITKDYLYGEDYLDKETMEAYTKMKTDASNNGYTLKISSGYRSYNVQVDLYNNYANRDGVVAADTYSARAGHSEHQSGLCFDLNGTNSKFLETETGKWVNDNAYKYGFILRYPKDKENYTGYNYEAWHFRYVGVELATKLYNGGNWISLEEYMGIDSKYE